MNLRKKIGRIIEKRTVDNLKKEITKHIAGEIILDNGCGLGSFNYKKYKEKRIIYGADIRSNKDYPGIFKIANAIDLPFKDNYFDCLVFSGVIQYVKNYNKAFLEIKRVLKNNGRLIFATLNRKSLLRKFRIINPAPKREANEFQIFSYEDLIGLLKKYDFKIKNEIGIDYIKIPKKLCSNFLFICENEKFKVPQSLNPSGVFSRNEK